MNESIIPELPTPPERWPFKPGEAVWYEPSGDSQTKPYLPQLIPATIIDCEADVQFGQARIQRADKPRVTRVNAGGLMYRGFCASCQIPAVAGPGGRLECPNCDAPPVEMPPPDVLTLQWFPLDKWYLPMAIRRAAEHPDWCYWATREASSEAIDAAYNGMLSRLGLKEPAYGSTDNVRRWMREYHAIERLKFYALLDNTDGFHATYQELKRQQAGGLVTEVSAFIDELTRDKLPDARPIFIPINIERIADDSEPDGPCEITRWLERQFGSAA